MQRSLFEIKQNSTGYYFTFISSDNRVHVISRSFSDRAELEESISKVRVASCVADVSFGIRELDLLPAFRIQLREGGAVFELIGFRGEIVFSSVIYVNENVCQDAIEALKNEAQNAAILDSTIT